MVLGRTEAGPHRVLVYRGGDVSFIVPASLMARQQQEIQTAGYANLSPGEQLAIADLRQAIGHDFRCEIENGRAVALNATISAGRILPAGILARLPHLRSLGFNGGRFPGAGLGDLERLAELRTLWFSGVVCGASDLAALKNLGELESLTFYDCRSVNDEGVKRLAGLTALTRLSFYNEQILRQPPDPSRCITDASLADLSQLIRLQHLDLFGHQLSDASVPVLTRMTELQDLALSGHGFTDAGLEGLARLSKLHRLRLFETGVTTNGVAVLKRRLPELEIEAWGRNAHD
jgi:hypothetical protein